MPAPPATDCYKVYNLFMAEFRRKRSDTKIGSVEKKYNIDFGVRSDMKLGKFLKENGFPSLSKAIQKIDRAQKK